MAATLTSLVNKGQLTSNEKYCRDAEKVGKKLFKITANSASKTFMFYSCILFLFISLFSVTAYIFSARQINRSHIQQQLAIASETIKLRLATTVNSELSLVLKMADTQIIREYFLNPYDPELHSLVQTEFDIYQEHFNNKIIFWVSDVDKIFYATGSGGFYLDPELPENYWYNLTMNQTEKYNFNINYNPDLHQINLWVNVPVFDETEGGKKPIGMLGTGINLTDFSDFVASAYKQFDKNITPYIFNKYDEITSSIDYNLVHDKVHIDDHLGDDGKELIRIAQTLSNEGSESFIYGESMHLISYIPEMEWYLVVSYPLPGILALNRALNIVFFSMLFLILLMFLVMNILSARSESTMAEQNMLLLEANRKAEAASLAKSDFLAKMSHEIRTPMNAITGMTELLLRGDQTEESRMLVQDIKRASSNLISIINDILDFSKIEAGRLEIAPVKYQLSSLVNDVVSIIRMRLVEKPIRFYTNIDANIPNGLIGDEVRMRQILLNLLSNAVKYTDRGQIGIIIREDRQEEKKVWLRISVIDTGHGVRAEDQKKLFGDFIQVDMKKSGIEGTGLGLAITRRLSIAMGGDIKMESVYGMGSTFTVLLPQGIHSTEPFAAVKDAAQKKVLIYECRSVYAQSLCWTLENLGVRYTLVIREEDYIEALNLEKWSMVFSGYGLYERLKPIINSIPYEERPPLALMAEWGTEAYIPNMHFLSLPLNSLSVADILNGNDNCKGYINNSGNYSMVRFTFPYARLLVVDDIATNLKVAKGLLAQYQAQVDTCLSGAEAIEMVKQNKYDLILMDHMMPEMDGIEATAAIRAWEQGTRYMQETRIPIVALTANAISGMREMFLEKGFNDFLGKPIDVAQLDEILDRWIPKEKQGRNAETEKKLLILVDDNPENLRTGKNILSEKYTLATVPSASKLFMLLENNRPELILLDINMPEMDGYNAIKLLKSKSKTRDIPVILLSETADPAEAEKCRVMEAVACISKPFDALQLISCIEKNIID